jgi:hypothetical protein
MAATLSIKVTGDPVGQLQRSNAKNAAKMQQAMDATARDTAQAIVSSGRADISSAGNFGGKWISGLRARVTKAGGGNLNVNVTHSVKYWRTFQEGRVITGKPLLWLPVGGRSRAAQVYARNYPGRLVRVNRKAGPPPILLDVGSKQVKYVGVPSVRIPKKFHLLEIARAEAAKMKERYALHFRGTGTSSASATTRA